MFYCLFLNSLCSQWKAVKTWKNSGSPIICLYTKKESLCSSVSGKMYICRIIYVTLTTKMAYTFIPLCCRNRIWYDNFVYNIADYCSVC